MGSLSKQKDPSVTFLNKWGYNVVKLPRAGIEPMDVVGKDQLSQWLGPLSSIWTTSVPVPMPGPPEPAANVNGQKTDALDLSVGLGVLSNVLAAFGASTPSLSTAFTRARKVQFSYTDVVRSEVPVFAAGGYLVAGQLHTDNPAVQRYFQDPNCEAFLITAVLKSASITVTASDEHGTEVDVDVPALYGMVSGKVGVKASGNASSTVTFTGTTPVTFGFALQQVDYAGGKWSLRDAKPGGETAIGFVPVDPPAEPKHALLPTAPDSCCVDVQYDRPA
jgi:hypothetical protein